MIKLSNNKAAVIGDLHLGLTVSSEVTLAKTVKYHIAKGQWAALEWAVKDIRQKGMATAVLLGDIFDSRSVVQVEDACRFREFLEKNNDISWYIIQGNHDSVYENTQGYTSIYLLGGLPNVTIIRQDTMNAGLGNTHVFETENRKWVMAPWLSPDILPEFEKWLPSAPRNAVLFGHFDTFGVMRDSRLSDSGINPDLFYDNFPLTISGHYHLKVTNSKGDSKLIYTGSLCPMTRISAGKLHGYWILDDKTLGMEFVANTVSPQFISITLPSGDAAEMDLTNSLVEFVLPEGFSEVEEFELKKFIDLKKPLHVEKKYPIKSIADAEDANLEVRDENGALVNIRSLSLVEMSELYIDKSNQPLPALETHADAKAAVVNTVKELIV